jgi:acyl-CoA thioesterase-1
MLFAAFTPTAAAARTVLCLGDSLTEGLGVAKEQAFPALLAADLAAAGFKDVQVVNAGVSGATSASGLSRLRWHLKGVKPATAAAKVAPPAPDILLLALGANDGLRGLAVEAMEANLQAVIELAKANGWRVLLAGMKVPPNYGPDYARRFERVFVDLAQREKVELMPFLLAGVAGDKTLNQADGIHPNVKGHRVLATTVRRFLEPMLKP